MSTDGYNVTPNCGTKSHGTIKDRKGKSVAYFDSKRPLSTIKVRCPPNGPRLGPHVLKKGMPYMLGCRWDAFEKRKWQEFGARCSFFTLETKTASYTAEEAAFVKKNYGSESHFLILHGLRIHVQEDCEEGRAILRAIIREDGTSSDEEEDDKEFNFDEESEFEGHQADYNFTGRQLDWIEKHYRNSEQFVISYGLKFYNDEDLHEAESDRGGYDG